MTEEGIGLDVAGGGEIITALKAGADPALMVLHGAGDVSDGRGDRPERDRRQLAAVG